MSLDAIFSDIQLSKKNKLKPFQKLFLQSHVPLQNDISVTDVTYEQLPPMSFKPPIVSGGQKQMPKLQDKPMPLHVSSQAGSVAFELRSIETVAVDTGSRAEAPKFPIEIAKFTLSNTFTGFASAFRRIMFEDLPMFAFTFTDEDNQIDNPRILPPYLRTRIESLPVHPKISQYASGDYDILLEKHNSANYSVNVFSSDIKIQHKLTKRIIDTSQFFEQNQILFGDSTFAISPETRNYLGASDVAFRTLYKPLPNQPVTENGARVITERLGFTNYSDVMQFYTYDGSGFGLDSKHTLRVKLKLIKGTAAVNGNAFVATGQIGYRPVRGPKYTSCMTSSPQLEIVNDLTKTIISESCYQRFEYTLRTNGIYSAREVLNMSAKILQDKFLTILQTLPTKALKLPFQHSSLTIFKDQDKFVYTFQNTNATVTHTLTQHIALLHPTQVFASCREKNPAERKSQLVISSQNHLEIVRNSLKILVNDCELLKQQILKICKHKDHANN